MYARLTLLEIDTVRTSMGTALEHYETKVAPRLREQPGYRGVYVLATPEGKGAILSLWDTQEQAATEGAHSFYAEALGSFATFYRSAPGRERYEVLYVDEPDALVR
jgi:heme-degrading monooxygenase HmoA